MFTTEEKELLNQFLEIQDNIDDVLLHLDSKGTSNKWILVDFSEKFEERYGMYLKKSESNKYSAFNQVKAISNVLNLISSYETKTKKV